MLKISTASSCTAPQIPIQNLYVLQIRLHFSTSNSSNNGSRSWENDEKKSIKQQAHKIPNEKKDGEKTLFQLIYKRNFLIRCAKQHNPIYGCSVFSSGSFFFEHWTMFNSPLNSIFLRLCIFFSVGQSISDTWDNVSCFVHLQCECSKTSLWTAIKAIRAQNEDGNG